MRSLALAGAVVIGMAAFAGRADAQMRVIGTRGTPAASLGYYSPYPGALYSPFAAPAPRAYSGFVQPWYQGQFVAPRYGTTVVSPGYYGVTRSYSPGFHVAPRTGFRPHRRW
jgi:hypothetical protein